MTQNKNAAVRLVNCAYCGKTLKLKCPDGYRSPQSVKTLKKGQRLFTSLSHRKAQTSCSGCFKICDVYWLYGFS